ncbi:MAG: prepilin-type N-terminal cleavage/methylation domain-containing protein [Desulfobacterales bacterium]|jgi:prepilin-type N-terminal cleavage/methylation domain-containing protein
MDKNKGFGLIELLAALGILAIILAVALPNFLGWRSNAQLRSVAEEFRRAAQLAKSKAIQEREIAVIDLDPDVDGRINSYIAFLDSDTHSSGNFSWQSHDPDEPVIYQRDLPENISIQLVDAVTGEPSNSYMPKGKVLNDLLTNLAVNGEKRRIEEKGIAGSLLPVDFHESKIHFTKDPVVKDTYQVLYDGEELDWWIHISDIYAKIVFYSDGECVTPIKIIVTTSDGEKLMIEITNWTITKVTKLA